MNIEFGKSWQKKLKGRIETYNFEVGILDDKPHRYALDGGPDGQDNLGSYAGGPIRKASMQRSPKTVGDIFIENMERKNINFLLRPFQERNSEILRFTTAFLRMVVAKSNARRVENLLQAVVRNPILRQEYGANKSSTADAKGFNRYLFNTGQMFKAIKARTKRVRG